MVAFISLLCLMLVKVLQVVPVNLSASGHLTNSIKGHEAVHLDIPLVQPPLVVHNTPMTFEDSDYDKWRQLETDLYAANSPVELDWYGYGGRVDYGLEFIRVLEYLHVKHIPVTLKLEGMAASMHAMVTCYADTLLMKPGSVLLFHPVKFSKPTFFGLFTYTSSDVPFGDMVMDKTIMDQCISKGLLTSKEEESILVDKKTVYKVMGDDGKLHTVIKDNDEE